MSERRSRLHLALLLLSILVAASPALVPQQIPMRRASADVAAGSVGTEGRVREPAPAVIAEAARLSVSHGLEERRIGGPHLWGLVAWAAVAVLRAGHLLRLDRGSSVAGAGRRRNRAPRAPPRLAL